MNKDGAEGGIRTHTGLRPLRPERSASANSATSAREPTPPQRRGAGKSHLANGGTDCQASPALEGNAVRHLVTSAFGRRSSCGLGLEQ